MHKWLHFGAACDTHPAPFGGHNSSLTNAVVGVVASFNVDATMPNIAQPNKTNVLRIALATTFGRLFYHSLARFYPTSTLILATFCGCTDPFAPSLYFRSDFAS